jgi:hypothetical protein
MFDKVYRLMMALRAETCSAVSQSRPVCVGGFTSLFALYILLWFTTICSLICFCIQVVLLNSLGEFAWVDDFNNCFIPHISFSLSTAAFPSLFMFCILFLDIKTVMIFFAVKHYLYPVNCREIWQTTVYEKIPHKILALDCK